MGAGVLRLLVLVRFDRDCERVSVATAELHIMSLRFKWVVQCRGLNNYNRVLGACYTTTIISNPPK